MKRQTSIAINVLLIVATLALFSHEEALAYLDAGSTSLILQVLLSSLFGALIAVRVFWGRIVTVSRRLFSRKYGHPNVRDDG